MTIVRFHGKTYKARDVVIRRLATSDHFEISLIMNEWEDEFGATIRDVWSFGLFDIAYYAEAIERLKRSDCDISDLF